VTCCRRGQRSDDVVVLAFIFMFHFQNYIHLQPRMFHRIFHILALLFFVVKVNAASTWTYKVTNSSCAATDTNPCGPVSNFFLLHLNESLIALSYYDRNIGERLIQLVMVLNNLQLIFLKQPLMMILAFQNLLL
jgi:hypothetical protein